MQRAFLLIVLTTLLWSCQKEGSVETPPPPSPPNTADTLVSIVVDGDYGGYAFTDYDSAVLKYTTNHITIQHYSRNKALMATENIHADNAERVLKYQQQDPSNTYRLSRRFEYSGTDLLPSAIEDTIIEGSQTEISRTSVTQSNPAGTAKTYSFLSAVKYLHNPSSNYSLATASTFDNSWRLLSHSFTNEYRSAYHYNTSGDLDSSYSKTLGGGDDTYAVIRYTTDRNPLFDVAQAVYKNMAKYAVVDNLNNSHFENLLDISYFPSELFSSRIPLKSSFGWTANLFELENTFTYRFENSELRGLVITHRDVATGEVSQTQIQLLYQ